MTLLLAALTIVAGIGISEIQNKIGWANLILSLALIVMFYWSTLWLLGKPLAKILLDLKQELIQQRAPTQFSWLLDVEQLVSYERTTAAKEIWLVTSDLLDDYQGGPFVEVVRQNLQKGTSYVYFFPSTVENKARAETIRTAHKQNNSIKFVFLPDNFFLLVPNLDIVIYNPKGDGDIPTSAFMGIPVPGESNHYHVSVSLDLIHKIVGTLLDSYKKQVA